MRTDTQKLFKVILKGMTANYTGVAYGTAYVIAKDPTAAYDKVKNFLDNEDLGFRKDRELHSVELLAEDSRYTDTGFILHF